jgi:hypothetical protein
MGYGMFTGKGNEAVHALVVFAKQYKLNSKSVADMLLALSENSMFSEATDTVVRERVFAALNS